MPTDDEKKEAEERRMLAERTIMAQLQSADAATVLSMAIERQTLTMSKLISKLDENNWAMQQLGRQLPDQ